MVCPETLRANSCPARIGGEISHFVTENGLNTSTPTSAAVRATSLSNSASLTRPSSSGYESTAFRAAVSPRHERSSIGEWSARITQCGTRGESLTLAGLVALRQSDNCFTQARNGRMRAHSCGSETMPHASGAAFTAKRAWTCHFTFITSYRLPLNVYGLSQAISSCSVKHVINSSTPGRI